ncbi:MAG: hypothetical protein APG12_01621 [Candidatus Methanofastidiosum methylothiophilum]|uniref:Uncharacterized protein n=1 Tax=Candidatus Methanofastidiosum methylothiophilum TaxID=1705564 RepID=A0A150IHZ2_9EURY|nr:MAG: hypothetical protein APG10_01577 [Candidatus Methanofastidiosum methylthiophilus]KYC46774.1 MAG: hypothetical protein APG11_01678 [Candidatus Methanofastidiosum methylthiophilus]KYC49201.1 MAG: hypothetical protein APG12_01621 [Candidatus Methanofastidiosum methylthiophilus]
MSLTDDLKNIVSRIPAKINEKKGIYEFEVILAERKAFLSKQKLIYSAKFRVDEQNREVRFTEMLKESGAGMSSGGSDDMSSGFGFKKESYNTMSGSREGTIEEQSRIFGKKYEYNFDYGSIRKQFESKTKENGYKFTYKITSIGL